MQCKNHILIIQKYCWEPPASFIAIIYIYFLKVELNLIHLAIKFFFKSHLRLRAIPLLLNETEKQLRCQVQKNHKCWFSLNTIYSEPNVNSDLSLKPVPQTSLIWNNTDITEPRLFTMASG